MARSLKFHPDKWPEQIDNAVAVEAYKIIVSARDAIFDQKLSEALERKVSADIVLKYRKSKNRVRLARVTCPATLHSTFLSRRTQNALTS